MTDEKLVTDFINKEYKVILNGSSFSVRDIVRDKNHTELSFKQLMIEIFGNFNGFESIFNKWFDDKKNILIKRLNDYFITLDLEEKSVTLIEKCVTRFMNDDEYSTLFVTDMFEKFYIKHAIKPLVENFLTDKNKELTSNNLISLAESILQGETPKIYEEIITTINKWYYDNVFYNKILDFINNTRVGLGPTNWIAKHNLHGTLNLDRFNSYFANETTYQQFYFGRLFNQWYNDKVIEISEKMMEEF
jgi:hypothetical protein